MLETYAYLCDLRKCDECTFPECSHTTDKSHRFDCHNETEMRLLRSVDGVNYYMEYVKRPVVRKGE